MDTFIVNMNTLIIIHKIEIDLLKSAHNMKMEQERFKMESKKRKEDWEIAKRMARCNS